MGMERQLILGQQNAQRAGTFRTPGRAGTTGQHIFALYNGSSSTKKAIISSIVVDMTATVVKAVTVLPPAVRVYKVTVLPTNGTAVTKVPMDSNYASDSSISVFQDASADGTSSASALTATLPAGTVVDHLFAPRLITAAGAELTDSIEFDVTGLTLRAGEGIVVELDYVLATQNPVTDMWLVRCDWVEV